MKKKKKKKKKKQQISNKMEVYVHSMVVRLHPLLFYKRLED